MSGIPPARDTDAEDVSWALQTAETQWKRNDRKDALVWLRRAAQAAVQAMDDDRGLELAHCAAELAEQLAAEAKALEAKPPLESLIPVSLGEVELGDSTEVRPTMPPLSVEDSDVQSLPPSAPPEGTGAPSPTIPRAPGVPAIGKRDAAPTSKRSPNMPLPAGVLSQIGRTHIDAKSDEEDEDTDHGLDTRASGDDRSLDAPTLPPLGGRPRDALSEAPELASVPPDDTALTEPPSANPNANDRAGGRPIPGLRPMRAPMPTPIAEVPRFVRMKARTPTAPPPREGDFPRDPREEPVEHQVDLPTPTPPPSGRSTAPPDPLYTPAPLPNLGDHDDDDTDVGHSVGIHVQIPQALLRPPLDSQTDLLTLSEPAPPGESSLGDHHLTEPVPRTAPRKAEPVTLQFKRPDIPEELKRDPKPLPKDPPTMAVMRPDLPNRANPEIGNPNHPSSGAMGPNDPPTIAARRPDLPKGYSPKTEPVTVSFKRPDPAAIAAAEAELKAKQAAKAAASAASPREETTREEPALTEPVERPSKARESRPAVDETKPSRLEPTGPAPATPTEARPENPRPGPPRPTPGQSVRPGPPRPTPSSAPARPKPAAPATAKPAGTQPTRAATPAPPVVRIDERAEPVSEARLPDPAPSEPSLPESAEDTSPAPVEPTKTPVPPAVSTAARTTPVPPAPEPEASRPTAPPPPPEAPATPGPALDIQVPPPREQQITRSNEANLSNESLTLEPVRETFTRAAEPSTRQVAALSASRAEAILADTAERSASSPAVVSLDLSDVEAFADLPEDARDTFAAAATITKLTSGEEVADFALAYVISGDVDVSATIVDATASQLGAGGVLRAHGTPEESVPLRLVCTSQEARVATWSADAVEAAFKSCPWVEDDLRAASDQVQTLAGVTMGPLGDRLDVSLRQQVTSRLKVRSLLEGETIVEAGSAVPGIVVVGVGKLELVDKTGKVVSEIRSGDFLFPEQVLGAGPAPHTARAGKGGSLVMVGDRRVAQELMVTCPPLLEILAGM